MEKKPNIEFTKSPGLKCDNTSCDYKNTEIPETEIENWINRPCPKCGENLLTEEDYKNSLILEKSIEFINSLNEDELNTLSKMYPLEKALESEFFKNAKGLENLDLDKEVMMTVQSHKGIKVTEIKNTEDGNNQPK